MTSGEVSPEPGNAEQGGCVDQLDAEPIGNPICSSRNRTPDRRANRLDAAGVSLDHPAPRWLSRRKCGSAGENVEAFVG